ncbi:MAG: alpha-hydroxy-acid oxidizing protein [Saprospiraceae bacterium]|nr:alpha-hydroxy-acid oxidizing protein [Saprospiraceae bacterium]
MKGNFSALDRQRFIYLTGVSGKKTAIPTDLNALEALVKDRMSPEAFAYIAGGAGVETTISNNRHGFDQWQIVPRMLRDVSQCDLSVQLLGQKLPAPLLLSPVGVLEMAHRKGDLAVGTAAATLGVPFIFSNQASVAMEKVSEVMSDSPRWFQLYWSRSSELVESLVKRAEACGCGAIVVTLDTTMLGWRLRDLDMAYLPFLRGKGIAQYTSDPVFRRLMQEPDDSSAPAPRQSLTLDSLLSVAELMRAYPGGLLKNVRSRAPLKAVRKFINIYTNPALQWEQLPLLRQYTKLPILLKGILHPDDARKAVDMGIDGIVVSNHGGRQVDGAISTIGALPGIAEAVKRQIPVLLDSGVRCGADMFKALALGANAVCIGRPYVYALALAGEKGVNEVIRNLVADFELTMRLSGCRSIDEITPATVVKSGLSK